MINISKLKTLLFLIVPLLFLAFTIFTACEKTKEKIVEVQKAPVIQVDSIEALPGMVTQGEKINLKAVVTAGQGAGTLTYSWFADGGSITESTADTAIWTAPGDSGIYTVSVHVTDGDNIAIGTRRVGVDMYVPTVDPYYLGGSTCATCHAGKASEWDMTGHAVAWASLMTSDHAGPSCFPCHSVQTLPELGATPIAGNSGFDDVPTAMFENVQCENCHGPGSTHITGPATNQEILSFNADICGSCHEGAHHPYLDEWQNSLHGQALSNAHAATNGSCQGCHEGVASAMRLATSDVAFYGGGGTVRDTLNYHGINGNLTASIEAPFAPISCQVCHNPHSAENVGQLRTVKPVTLISDSVVTGAGAGQLCLQCHHSRHSAAEQVAAGDAHFGPHPSTQGDLVFGQNGDEDVNTDPSFVWQSTGHHSIPDVCAACHVYMTSADPITGETSTGHTFEPNPSACQQCHGTQVTAFTDIMARKDYDNDGTIAGLQDEVLGLMDLLAAKLVETDTTDTLMGTDPTVEEVVTALEGTAGITTPLAVKLRTAGWNLVYAVDDASKGIHNPAYMVQLLQQSVLFLDPTYSFGNGLYKRGSATTFAAARVE